MKGNTELNVQIRLAKTPTSNYPSKETDIFQIKYTSPVPTDRVKDGEVVIRNDYISIDAAMRTWISTKTYMNQIMPGDVMVAQTVGEVIFSKSKRFQVGDPVLAMGGWQKFVVLP
jgi:NADPH-dependent curcumin reductase CurA